MIERPILFSGEMVRAILEGRKTQTRRRVKGINLEAIKFMSGRCDGEPEATGDLFQEWHENQLKIGCAEYPEEGYEILKCPYGMPGDRLWVRESWAQLWRNGEYCIHEEVDIKCIDCRDCKIEYKADINNKYPGEWDEDYKDDPDCPKWRPSIHMPRWASRIMLGIVNIKVERLQEIKEADCFAEGIKKITTDGAGQQWFGLGDRVDIKTSCVSPQGSFKKLWDSINGKPYPWSSNPWVWVIEFRRIK